MTAFCVTSSCLGRWERNGRRVFNQASNKGNKTFFWLHFWVLILLLKTLKGNSSKQMNGDLWGWPIDKLDTVKSNWSDLMSVHYYRHTGVYASVYFPFHPLRDKCPCILISGRMTMRMAAIRYGPGSANSWNEWSIHHHEWAYCWTDVRVVTLSWLAVNF